MNFFTYSAQIIQFQWMKVEMTHVRMRLAETNYIADTYFMKKKYYNWCIVKFFLTESFI